MGSSNKPQTIGFRYFFGIHVGLCRGPIDELREWRGADRVAWRGSAVGQARFQVTASSLYGGDEGEGGLYGTADLMQGTETQPVNPRLKKMLGSALVPAFRGVATLFYDGLICSMSPYPKPWSFRVRRVVKGWDDDIVWYEEKAAIAMGEGTIKAMNPAHIIYEAFTNRDWGRGRPAARIHDASFRAAADKLYAEGFGLCICWRRQDGIGALVKSIIDHIGGLLIDDLVTGQVSLKLIRDDYVVDELPLFDEDSGLLGIDADEAADGSMATNEVVVKFRNMMIDGNDDQVRVQNIAGIQSAGAVLSETINYPHVPTASLAGRMAQRELRSRSSAVRRFTVRLDRKGSGILPGSVFRVRSLKRGYGQLVLRAGPCDYGTLQEGTVTIKCVVDAYGLPDTAYVAVQDPTIKLPTRDPLPATIRRTMEIPYRDLAAYLTPEQLAAAAPESGAAGILARRPSAAATNFMMLTKVGSAAYGGVDSGDWCPTAQVVDPLDYLTTETRITYGTDISTLQTGDVGLLDDEIVRVDSLDLSTGEIVLARGCADTVPAKHVAGARIWFYGKDVAVDPADYSAGVTVNIKVQTRTTQGLLDPADAPTDNLLLAQRQARPYSPGQFQINSEYYPADASGDITLTWSHRDRLSQADQLIETTFGSVGPEAGTTYSVRILRADTNAVLASETGLSGTSVVLTPEFDGLAIIELWSERDGLQSWQRHRHTLPIYRTATLSTEAGEQLLTESGEPIILEA